MVLQKSTKGRPVEDRFSRLRTYVMVITTGRSGSSFFADLVNRNALNASSEHEPNLFPVDVSTQWYYDGQEDKIADLVERKIARLRRGEVLTSLPIVGQHYKRFARGRFRRLIPRVPMREIYIEVDNAFLKCYGNQLLDAIPDLQFIHLTRNPLLQAKSAENRKYHPKPNRPYLLWPTWERNTFRLSEEVTAGLSDFQLALWYWFEMELRFADLMEHRGIRPLMEVCIDDLNDAETVERVFAGLGVKHRALDLQANRNLGPKQSLITDREREEAFAFLKSVPDRLVSRLPTAFDVNAA